MFKTTLQEIAEILNAKLILRNNDTFFEGVCIDSRIIHKNNLYIPIIGANFDGHQFIENVLNKGVKNIIIDHNHDIPESGNILIVENTIVALQQLATYYLTVLKCEVVAVTGSNGKTAIKDILYNILSSKYRVEKTQGNKNNEIGLPLTVLALPPEVEIAILEMGMERFKEIELLTNIAKPNIAIISNIGTAHLVELGSRENIAKAKLEILSGLKQDGILVVSGEEKLLSNQYENTKYTYPSQVSNYLQHVEGMSFEYDNEVYTTNIHGQHQIENILMCLEVAKYYNIPIANVKQSLLNLELTKMRQDIYVFGDNIIYDDSYKSNPESLYAALSTLQQFPQRKIAVLADMLDLGQDEKYIHQKVGENLIKYDIDKVYLYGELCQYTHMHSSVMSLYFEDKKQLAECLKQEKNAIILFKASRSLKMEEVISQFKGE